MSQATSHCPLVPSAASGQVLSLFVWYTSTTGTKVQILTQEAGFYEFVRIQQTGYRVSREEQSEMDAVWQEFKTFLNKFEIRINLSFSF